MRTSPSHCWPNTRASATSGCALHEPVEVGRADADAARVERGVAAAVDDDAAVVGPRGEVALAPHAREPPEVRVPVAGPDLAERAVAPEAEGHRREGCGADELAGARAGRQRSSRPRTRRRWPCRASVVGSRRRRPGRWGRRRPGRRTGRCRPRSRPGGRRTSRARRRSGSPRATAASRWSRSCAGCAARGCGRARRPPLARLSMSLAETPSRLIPSSSTRSKRRSAWGTNGDPS